MGSKICSCLLLFGKNNTYWLLSAKAACSLSISIKYVKSPLRRQGSKDAISELRPVPAASQSRLETGSSYPQSNSPQSHLHFPCRSASGGKSPLRPRQGPLRVAEYAPSPTGQFSRMRQGESLLRPGLPSVPSAAYG